MVKKFFIFGVVAFGLATAARAEGPITFFLQRTSMTWEKISLKEIPAADGNLGSFEILATTSGTKCDIFGHAWDWMYYINGAGARTADNMKCSVCGTQRLKKTSEHKREVVDVEERWADDDQVLEKPMQRMPNPTYMMQNMQGGMVPASSGFPVQNIDRGN